MARWTRTDPAPGDRAALIAKLSDHVRQQYDPRLVLVPEDQWPSPTPPYVDHIAHLYDDLVAGRAVNVETWMLRRGEAPPGCRLVRVDIDGTINPAPYDRGAPEPR